MPDTANTTAARLAAARDDGLRVDLGEAGSGHPGLGTRPDPTQRPGLRAEALVVALARRRVRWVLAGSGALAGYGARWEPRDLDVVPALDAINLGRVAATLADLDAVPAFGAADKGALELAACRAWRAPVRAVHETQLDLVFVTAHGLLDVVPRRCGDYPALSASARWQPLGPNLLPVLVAHPAHVLACLPGRSRKDGRRRPKDAARAMELDRLRSDCAAGRLRWDAEALTSPPAAAV